MGRWLFNALAVLERIVIVGAAILAGFPMYQYWKEAPDRARERIVQEAQLVSACIQFPPGELTDLTRFGKYPLDLLILEQSAKIRLSVKCYQIGSLSQKDKLALHKSGVLPLFGWKLLDRKIIKTEGRETVETSWLPPGRIDDDDTSLWTSLRQMWRHPGPDNGADPKLKFALPDRPLTDAEQKCLDSIKLMKASENSVTRRTLKTSLLSEEFCFN